MTWPAGARTADGSAHTSPGCSPGRYGASALSAMPSTVRVRAVPGSVRVSPGSASRARARLLSSTTPSGAAGSSQCPVVSRGRPTEGRSGVARSSTEARVPRAATVADSAR